MSEQDPLNGRIEIYDGSGVVLRQLAEEDAQAYFDLIEYDREHLSQEFSGERIDTADNYQTVEDVLETILHPKNPQKRRFGILVEGVMVGSNNLTPLGDGKVESGSWIGKEYTGHHYAARARDLLVQVAFDVLGFEEIISNILVGNDASRKSVEKSGFEYQGIIKKPGRDGKLKPYWHYVLRKRS